MNIKDSNRPLSYEAINFQKDIEKLLNNKLALKIQLNNEPAYIPLLILLLFAPVISFEEILYYIRADISDVKNMFESARIMGYTKSVHLYPESKKKYTVEDPYDSRTLTGVILTKKGFTRVKEYTYKDDYYTFKSDKYYMHAYSNGFNFLAILTNPFLDRIDSYENEVGATFGRRIAGDGRSLYIDSMARVGSDTLYLEQEMGTSRKEGELRIKLQKYGYHEGYLTKGDGRQAVVLSFRKGFVSIAPAKNSRKNIRYNPSVLNRIIDFIHEKSYDLYFPETIEQLAEYAAHENKWITCARDVLNLWQDIQAHDLTHELSSWLDLSVLVSELESYSSDLYIQEFNSIQEDFAIKWRNRLIEELLESGIGTYGRHLDLDIQAFVLGGLHMYVVPTQMIGWRLPFILYQGSFVKSIIEKTILCYSTFRGFNPESYTAHGWLDNTDIHRIPDSPIRYGLALSNRYEADQFIFFIENLSLDLGASVRLAAALQCIARKKPEGGKNIIIIALVKDDEDALYFSNRFKLFSIPNLSSFQVLFLNIEFTYWGNHHGWEYIEDYIHDIGDEYDEKRMPTSPLYRFYNEQLSSKRPVFTDRIKN